MNILQVQDDLKNFSQQQLVQEMKQPKGVAPQFLVLGEITRRKRMSDDMKTRGAADQNTVAQDVVSAAGVPQGGLAQMSQAMAPKSSVEPNMQPQGQAQPQAPMPMASGGILSLAGGGGKTKREKAFFLEFPKNSPIFAGERRYVTANTLEQLESSMPLFFKRMRSRGVIIPNENAPEAFQETATKLAPAQLNIAVRRGKENIAQAEEAARIAGLQAETGATDDQAVTSGDRPTESQVINEVQSLDAPVAEPSEFDIQQDSDIEGDLLMADDYEKAEKERLRQEALATGLVPSETTDMIRNQKTGVRPFSGSAFPSLADERPYPDRMKPTFNAKSDEAAAASLAEIERLNAFNEERKRNALAYKEGRTPAQEKLIEDARGKARDSAITALGEIDRSPDPYEDDVVIPQDAMDYLNAINADTSDPSKTKKMADDYLRGRGDLQAPSSIGGGAEAQMLAEGRPMTEAEYLFNMQRQQNAIKNSGGFIPPNIGAIELNQPSVQRGLSDEAGRVRASRENYANRVTAGQNPRGPSASELQDYIAEQQLKINEESRLPSVDRNLLSAEDYDAIAVQKANQESANQARELQSALSADVDVRDAGLGGAFAKGDEGIERRFRGLGPFEDSTSEIIQDQLDKNKSADERQERYDDLMITGSSGGVGDYDQGVANEQGEELPTALSADVDVRDAELGGAFAKGDEGTKQGFLFDDQSTSEIIQDQLDENLERDSIKALSETELFGNQGPMAANEVKIAAQEQELFGNQGPKAASPKSVSIRDTSGESTGNDALDRRKGLGVYSDPYRNPIMDNVIPQLVDTKVDENATPYQDVYDVVMGNTAADSLNTDGPFTPNEDTRITRMKGLADQISSGELTPTALEFAKKDLERLRAAVERTGGQDKIENYFSNQILGPALRGAKKYGVKAGDFAINDLGIGNLISQAAGPRIAGAISDYTSENAANADKMQVAAGTTDNEIESEAIVSALGLTPSDAGSAGEGTTDQAVKADKISETQTQAAEGETTSDTSLAGSIDEAVNTGAAANALPTVRDTDDSKGGTSTKSGTGSSASSQIIDLLKSQEANADSDKWLALANAGMALMSSKQPTLGGALGEAGQVGIAGLMKSRQAGDAAKLKTLKFQAGIEAAARKAGLPKDRTKSYVSIYNNLQDNITSLLKETGSGSIEDLAMGTSGSGISAAQRTRAVNLIRKAQELEGALGISFGNSGVFNATS